MSEPVCEMQRPAVFTMAQPQLVAATTYSRVNPLPSLDTSLSFSGAREQPLFIGNDRGILGAVNWSSKLQLDGLQPQPQGPSWADEVTAEQSQRSTLETVPPNWVYSRRVRTQQP